MSPDGYNMTLGGENPSFENRRDYSYGKNPAAKPVINLTTLTVYDSIKRAAEENQVSHESIKKAIKNKAPCCNSLWAFYDESKTYDTPIKPTSQNSRKKVKNTKTGEVFNSISAAADKYHIARKTIRDSCNAVKNGEWEYFFPL